MVLAAERYGPLVLLLGVVVFSLLKSSGVKKGVTATLKIESGMNDPMAMYHMLTLIG